MFFLSPLSPILLPRPVVCSFIVRTYTPAAIGSADEMNTLALREADAQSKVNSQRVSKTKKRKCSFSGSRMPYRSIAGLQWSMASSLLGDSPPCLFWGCLVGWLIRRLLVGGWVDASIGRAAGRWVDGSRLADLFVCLVVFLFRWLFHRLVLAH